MPILIEIDGDGDANGLKNGFCGDGGMGAMPDHLAIPEYEQLRRLVSDSGPFLDVVGDGPSAENLDFVDAPLWVLRKELLDFAVSACADPTRRAVFEDDRERLVEQAVERFFVVK